MTVDERAARIAALDVDLDGVSLESVATCNLCGGREHAEVGRRDRYGFPAAYCVCLRCGLGFLSPRPTAAEYARFYAELYRPLVSAYHGRTIDAETVQEDQRAYAAELVAFLCGALDAHPRSVLDIGGSTGVVAAAVGEVFDATATVVDPSPEELRHAEALGLEVVPGLVEDVELDRSYDLVLLCQTIDHLLDVSATLGAIRRWLAPAGRAFVDVLDVDFMLRRTGAIEWAVKIDHPYYLTRETALAFFARAGLAPVRERLADDGHLGFLLAAADPREPDLERLRLAAERHLRTVWELRAAR